MHIRLNHGFGVFNDTSKTTSGQRFFNELTQELSSESIPLYRNPKVILFNISAPWKTVLFAKLRKQKIVLRVDGLYSDKLSDGFINELNFIIRLILKIGIKCKIFHNSLAHFANFINQNYSGFFRILLADYIIYQSIFSYRIHQKYFPMKPYSIIVNGSKFKNIESKVSEDFSSEINLVTIYDDWKPAKRIQDIVHFVQWANEVKQIPIYLSIIGYTGKVPIGSASDMKVTIEDSPYIRTLPRFKIYSNEVSMTLIESDLYISFSYRDPCPNVIVEAMAHGLPVVAIGSGGVPDIVGSAGILLPANDFENGFFSAHRYEYNFPRIDFEKVLEAIQVVMANYENYEVEVRKRFESKLGIDVVASRYAKVMRQLIVSSHEGVHGGRI